MIDFAAWPDRLESARAGLLLVIPDLVNLDLPALAATAGYPGTRVIPAVSWLLSLLALKLTRTRRVSHVDDLLADPAAALLAGLAVLPKKSALTGYSYRLSHDHQHKFLAALDAKMIASGLASAGEAIFDLDFHAVMHWGQDPALEKHYVPKRSQRARSVLTFFAQDSGTRNLIYASADISKATQAREAIAFCDHWKAASGKDPAMLVMDQKVTTQQVLGELDARGVKFLTLRMRSPALTRYIASLQPGDFKTVTLDRAGNFGQPAHPRVHEDPAATLTAYPGTVRQLIVTGLGHDTPTVIITNDRDTTTRNLIRQYARRMTIEQRLAEIIRAFCADALSTTVNLNVDLDIMLCRPGPGPPRRTPRPAARLRRRHPRRHPAPLPRNTRPDHHHQRHHHRPARTTRLLTRPAQSQPARQTPACPGGAAGPSATSTSEPCAEPPAWKSALALRKPRPGRRPQPQAGPRPTVKSSGLHLLQRRMSYVRSWEQDGMSTTLSGAVRRGHRAWLTVSDVQECRSAGDLRVVRSVRIKALRFLAHPCPCVLETRRLWAPTLDPDREPIRGGARGPASHGTDGSPGLRAPSRDRASADHRRETTAWRSRTLDHLPQPGARTCTAYQQ